MFKKIVWATDGSDSANRALPYARDLAKDAGASLLVLHAVETYAGSRAAGLPLYVDEEQMQTEIQGQVAQLRSEGVDAELTILTGLGVRAAHAIADAARDAGADLIVTGTRGHTALGGLLLGSVAQRLLHIAPCPVLAVPAKAEDTEGAPAKTEVTAQQG